MQWIANVTRKELSVYYSPLKLLLITVSCVLTTSASAKFTTVLNSPPDTFSRYDDVGSNTQVNLLPGGMLPAYYYLGDAETPADNIEINLLGGLIAGDLYISPWANTTNVSVNLIEGNVLGTLNARHGTHVTVANATIDRDLELTDKSVAIIHGGLIKGELTADTDSFIQVSGGEILQGIIANNDSSIQLSGGRIEDYLAIISRGTLDWSGGSAGSLHVRGASKATLFGDDFKIDGIPITGLDQYPKEIMLNKESVLSGILSDGTPIAITETGFLQDHLSNGVISVSLTDVPSYELGTINGLTDSIPQGLRSGQTLLVGPDVVTPSNFTALSGSEVKITGGEIGNGFEAVGAKVSLEGGKIGEQAILLSGSSLKAISGSIGDNFEVGKGSRLEMAGGSVDWVFVAHPESEVIYSGGTFKGSLKALKGSKFKVQGGDFKINGTPIDDLDQIGSTKQIDLPQNGILSGTLSDGTPFALGRSWQWIAPGSLTLEISEVPSIEKSVIRVSSEESPMGLRTGQVLYLEEGGELPDYFVAGTESVVRMRGGNIGYGFQAVGSSINIDDGLIKSLEALHGSVINQTGGAIERATVNRGGKLNVMGGDIEWLRVQFGGQVNISAGQVKQTINLAADGILRISGGSIQRDIQLREEARLIVEDGLLHDRLSAYGNSQIEFYGGRIGDELSVTSDSKAHIYGSNFRINGLSLPTDFFGSLSNKKIDLKETDVLSGVFSNGTPFVFSPSDGDNFQPGSLYLSSSRYDLLHNQGIDNNSPVESSLPKGLQPEQELTLRAGQNLGINFNAAWNSQLTIVGGEIGDNFEAVGANIDLLEGRIDNDADVFLGTKLNVYGGSVGKNLEIHDGGVVNLLGGIIEGVAIRNGGTLNVAGGELDELFNQGHQYGNIALESGAVLNIIGTEFELNNEPITGLTPGKSILLELDKNEPSSGLARALDRYRITSLKATLTDGSKFAVRLKNYPGDYEFGQYHGNATVRLTLAESSSSLPEPSAAFLLVSMATIAGLKRQF